MREYQLEMMRKPAAAPISVVDADLMSQPRLTCMPWPERAGWWRVRGTHGVHGVRGPELPGGMKCTCVGYARNGHCAHAGAVRERVPRCSVCGGVVISRLYYNRGQGYLITWQCIGAGCDYRRIL